MYVIRERFFALGDDFDVLDEHGTKLYRVDGKVLSVRCSRRSGTSSRSTSRGRTIWR